MTRADWSHLPAHSTASAWTVSPSSRCTLPLWVVSSISVTMNRGQLAPSGNDNPSTGGVPWEPLPLHLRLLSPSSSCRSLFSEHQVRVIPSSVAFTHLFSQPRVLQHSALHSPYTAPPVSCTPNPYPPPPLRPNPSPPSPSAAQINTVSKHPTTRPVRPIPLCISIPGLHLCSPQNMFSLPSTNSPIGAVKGQCGP